MTRIQNGYLRELKSKKIHVVGTSGAEGSAVVLFLARYGFKKVTCHDFCEKKDFQKSFFSFHDGLSRQEKNKEFQRLKRVPFKFCFKDKYLSGIEKADVIFLPQSWFRYSFNDRIKKCDAKRFSNLTKLYFNMSAAPIIAVTGTSGKSTTTRLIYEIFKKSGIKTYFTGNDRENQQILENIFDLKRDDVLIMEVSNRQLKIDLEKSPKIAVITNISPNHLDDHKNFADYIKTKKSLLKYQKPNDFVILNHDNKETFELGKTAKARVFYFASKGDLREGAFLSGGNLILREGNRENIICSSKDLKIPGLHNIENALAASLAAFLYGINTKIIRQAVIGFPGLKSRLELISEIKGAAYYEDSSACNPDGPRVAVQSFSQPKILIAGGERKKTAPGEFEEMAAAIVKNNVRALFLIGKKAPLIKEKVKTAALLEHEPGPVIETFGSLEEAVFHAYKSSRKGDVVILSPGCESFDMFSDYRHRARKFRKAVLALK